MSRYIDADAIVNFQFYDEEHEEYSLKAKKIIDFLEAYSEESIPIADVVEVKRGRWISDEDGNIECSVCGHHGVGDLYCERCGAKMDGKETEDE